MSRDSIMCRCLPYLCKEKQELCSTQMIQLKYMQINFVQILYIQYIEDLQDQLFLCLNKKIDSVKQFNNSLELIIKTKKIYFLNYKPFITLKYPIDSLELNIKIKESIMTQLQQKKMDKIQKVKITKEARITRMLLEKIPQTPIPQPYFTIPSPQPFAFPLKQTMLQGIKLLENYFPQQTNTKIRNRLKGKIERLSRHKDIYCVLGKGGKGMVVGQTFLDIRGVTAYCYGPNFFVIAYDDLRLDVYTLGMKLVKTLKNFTQRKINYLKLITTPPNYESIIMLSNCGNDICIHRIQKSVFSGLSHKFCKKVLHNLEYPVTQMIEIPNYFRYYLRKDPAYRDCTLIAVSAINCVWILKIDLTKLNADGFVKQDFFKRVHDVGTSSISWGETSVESSTRDLKGDKLVLNCTFGPKAYFFILKEVQKYSQEVHVTTKCEWLESYPFKLANQKNIAFCQFMKKSELLTITDDNMIIIFSTRTCFEIFDKQINEDQIECITEKFSQRLECRTVMLIPKRSKGITAAVINGKQDAKKSTHAQSFDMHMKKLREQIKEIEQEMKGEYEGTEDFDLINKQPLVTYADTFQYEYPSDEIYYLTDKQFGVYVYCDWQRISDHMKVEQRYESVMVFLIAIFKKVNKFDLGMGDPTHNKQHFTLEEDSNDFKMKKIRQKQLSEYIQLLSIQFITNKLLKIRDIPEILENIISNEEFFKLIIMPMEMLCETEEFEFLFDVIKDKIISSLIPFSNRKADNEKSYARAEKIFFSALAKFIEHGKIKWIPDTQLQSVMDWYLHNQQTEMVDRLAIYFDLQKIDQNIVVQCLLQNNLVVSLAHICTQGNESLFVTPFVKFWGVSENYKKLRKLEEAAAYALRALWYMKLCLQRNWILKEYSIEKYATMIGILSRQFLNEKILVGLLQIRPQYCLQTLAEYFTIQNAQIMNDLGLTYPVDTPASWIDKKPYNTDLQLLLTTSQMYIKKSFKSHSNDYQKYTNIFLSRIMINKTVRYTAEKSYNILINLIQYSKALKEIHYGLEEKMIEEFRKELQDYCSLGEIEFDQILEARYIVKILTLVYYQHQEYITDRLYTLYEKSRQHQLIDLQTEISFLQKNFNNCLQIYMKAKQSQKMLIYEFLEGSFKRLVLEKRRQDKQNLSYCIKCQIKGLVMLHPRKTKTLIQNYIPEIHEELIEALKDDEELQLDYFNDIMNDEYNPNLKQSLSEDSILRYIELMSRHRPTQLHDAFKKNPFFPIEESLKICEKYEVYDCIEYLYQRMGCITEAVKIAALRIDKILKTRNDYNEDDMLPYIQIKQILDNSIEICKKNHSEQVWQALLDSSIQLYKKYLDSDLPQDEIEIFFFINGQIMQNLAANCTIEHTIHLLQTKYNNLNMGGKMTKAFIKILEDLSHMINILYLSTDLVQASLRRELQRDYYNKLSCYRTDWDCETCRYPIDYREKSIHFQCGHCYHKECVVSQEPMTCVACLLSQSDQIQYYLNTLNPKFPKIKKINDLFKKFEDKEMEMREVFKIQEFEQSQKPYEEGNRAVQSIQKHRKERFEDFDSQVYEIECGNRRVDEELAF